MITEKQRDELRAPLDPSQLKHRKGHGNQIYYYVDSRDLMDRLDDVFGIEGYSLQHEPVVMTDNDVTVKTTLTIHTSFEAAHLAVIKSDFGQAQRKQNRSGEWMDDELYKNAATDGVRRVCVLLDVCACRSLYSLDGSGNVQVVDGRYALGGRSRGGQPQKRQKARQPREQGNGRQYEPQGQPSGPQRPQEPPPENNDGDTDYWSRIPIPSDSTSRSRNKGLTWRQIHRKNPTFIKWALDNWDWRDTDERDFLCREVTDG